MRTVSLDSKEVYEVFKDDEGNVTKKQDTNNAKFLRNLIEYKQGETEKLDETLMASIVNDKDDRLPVPKITYSFFSVRVLNSVSSPDWSEPTEVAILPLLFSLGYTDLIQQFMEPILNMDGQKLEMEDAYDLFDLAVPNNNVEAIKYLVRVASEDFLDLIRQNKEILVDNSKKYGAVDVAEYIESL
jgi:hypothetical protein